MLDGAGRVPEKDTRPSLYSTMKIANELREVMLTGKVLSIIAEIGIGGKIERCV
jgi:hypothetical protein